MRECTVVVCGTVMFDGASSVQQLNSSLAPELIDLIRRADISICDFETVLSVQSGKAQKAVSLVVDPEYAAVVKKWGFSHANCVHNHSLDGGVSGFRDTIEHFRQVGIVPIAGENQIVGSKHIVEDINGERVALLAYSAIGEISLNDHPMKKALADIAKYRRSCDHVLVFYHDGYDLAPIPLPSDQEKYRVLARAGADAVIVNQAHVFQGYEVHNRVPILHSTGNFVVHCLSDRRWAPVDKGVLITLTLGERTGLTIVPTSIDRDHLTVGLSTESPDDLHSYWQELNEWYCAGEYSWWNEFSARGVIAGPFLAQQLCSGLPLWWKKYGVWGLIRVLRVYLNRFHRQLLTAWFAGKIGIRAARYERFEAKG